MADVDLVTPHNLDAERALLGGILVENATIADAIAVVNSDDFFRDAHRLIFEEMRQLAERGDAIDYVTVKHALSNAGKLDAVNGPAYLASLADGVPRSSNVRHYANIVRELALVRRLVAYCRQADATFTADPAALANGAGHRFLEAVQRVVEGAHDSSATAVSTSLSTICSRLDEGRPARETVLGELLALGEIAMLHGQPRDGKSWTALEMALAVALGDTAFGAARFRVRGPGAVLIVGNEDGEDPIGFRARWLLAGRGLTAVPDRIRLIVGQGCTLDDRAWQDRIIREAQLFAVRLIILDPLRSLSACVDQGPHELQPLAAYLRRLARETGAAILVVHHDTKPPAVGPPDSRRRAQRASGGAIFSIVDAPMHVERIDDHRSLVAPDGFKFCETPAPFVVDRQREGDAVRLLAVDSDNAVSAADLALTEKVRAFLRDNPGSSGRAITCGVRANRDVVTKTLERLFEAGSVDAVDGARKARLWSLRG